MIEHKQMIGIDICMALFSAMFVTFHNEYLRRPTYIKLSPRDYYIYSSQLLQMKKRKYTLLSYTPLVMDYSIAENEVHVTDGVNVVFYTVYNR